MKCGDEHEAEEKRRRRPRQKADGDEEPAHQFEDSDVIRPEHAGLESRRGHPLRCAGNIPAPPAEELLASVWNEPEAERHPQNRVSETLAALVQRAESREYVSRSLLGRLHDGSSPPRIHSFGVQAPACQVSAQAIPATKSAKNDSSSACSQ